MKTEVIIICLVVDIALNTYSISADIIEHKKIKARVERVEKKQERIDGKRE